ncbi:MAG: Fe-S-containing hydro-lyase [Haloplasmataceae bacterium]|nr:Fe-S-containing hydro-lyase [Haloplasmataceae bacterium]
MKITTPLTEETINKLNYGEKVLITGTIYTARDAAHKRLVNLIVNNESLPFDIKNQIIYYVGPTPAKPNEVIGSAGPTTSYRMDVYTPLLLENGLKGMIGKGERTDQVIEAIKKYKAVYFGAVGGAAALIAKSIKKCELIAYPDLGAEAIYKLVVEDFPVVVINDCYGNDLITENIKKYANGGKNNE